jgi:hypothetical protein
VKRERVRLTVLVEDRRTEMFVRRVLVAHGVQPRNMTIKVAPAGDGAAEAWVLRNYPAEVRALRARNYQHDLALVVVRDGDNVGVERRRQQLDAELAAQGMMIRQPLERIAAPVPTWAIENWLLCLLDDAVDEAQCDAEGRMWKAIYERQHGNDAKPLDRAASRFVDRSHANDLPSLADGRTEFDRI